MEEIIAAGQADVGGDRPRNWLQIPILQRRLWREVKRMITPCLRCYECFGATGQLEIIKCTVNPKQGQQIQGAEPLLEPKRQKKVLVIGGGPGGMEAGITAAGRGHKVTTCCRKVR